MHAGATLARGYWSSLPFRLIAAMTLITFIVLYLLVSVGIGLYAATRVKNAADYAVAGRSLPLIMVAATTFMAGPASRGGSVIVAAWARPAWRDGALGFCGH